MKKLLVLIILIGTSVLKAQVFQARDLRIGLGSGAQILSFELSDTAGYRNYIDGLAGVNFTLNGEYGLAPFMGISAAISHTRMLSESNSAQVHCTVTEFAPAITYHLPWKNRYLDPGAAAGLGISGYRYQSYESNWARTEISSSLFFAEINSHIYFTTKNRWGVFTAYRFSYYFGYGESSDKTTPHFEYNSNGHSHTFVLGFFWRFGQSREYAPMNNN